MKKSLLIKSLEALPAKAPSTPAKERITIELDADTLAWFRETAKAEDRKYQPMINHVLRDYVAKVKSL